MAVLLTSVTGAAGAVSAVLALPMRWQLTQPISFLVNFSGNLPSAAQGTVSVQVSNDPNANPQNSNAATLQPTARWNNHDVLFSLTTDKNSSVVYPVAYARLIVNATVTGTVTLQIGIPDPLP